jgi:carbamoyl-phosphate synthase large subunit
LEFGVKINLPSIYSLSLRSKENLPILCEEIGISYPRTLVANNFYDASKFAEENGYPIYIKGHFYEAHLSYNAQQIEDIFIKLKYDWGLPIIAQQCLFGEEYNVTGIGDGSGNISVFCEIRKLLRTKNGKGFAGVVIDDPALFLNSLKIIKRLNWNGPFELEFIKSNNGIYYLIEMNPRFPAWVDFPSQLGCNMPAALMNAPTSSGLEKNQICAPGKMFIRHCIDLAGDMSDFADLSIDGMKKLKTYSRI